MPVTKQILLLNLYQAVVKEESFAQLASVIASWLADNDDPLEVLEVEDIAREILDRFEGAIHFGIEKDTTPPDSQIDATLDPAAILNAEEVRHGIFFDLNDHAKIISAFHSDHAQSILFKFYRDDDEFAQIGVLHLRDGDEPMAEFFYDDTVLKTSVRQKLMDDFGLTIREIRVIEMALQGLRVKDIAEHLERSVETIRSQLKSISGKFSVSSQAQVIAAVRKIEKFENQSAMLFKPSKLKIIDESEEFITPDASSAVLFVHCSTHGRHLPPKFVKRLNDMGISVFSPARPGFGNRPAPKFRGMALFDFLADWYAEYIQLRIGDRCVVVTHGLGMGVAYRLAARHPDLVREVIAIDGLPALNNDELVNEFRHKYRALAVIIRHAPTTFRLLSLLATKRIRTGELSDDGDPRHQLYPAVKLLDHETVEAISAMIKNTNEIRAQSVKGTSSEALAQRHDWSILPKGTNSKPMISLLATEDSVFISAEGSAYLASNIGANLIEAGATFPFLQEQTDCIINIAKRSAG